MENSGHCYDLTLLPEKHFRYSMRTVLRRPKMRPGRESKEKHTKPVRNWCKVIQLIRTLLLRFNIKIKVKITENPHTFLNTEYYIAYSL
jgi:hypothetical protein